MLTTETIRENGIFNKRLNENFYQDSFWLNSLVSANLFISTAALFVSFFANLILDKPQNFFLNLSSFAVMFLIYTANRFSDIEEDEINSPKRVLFVKKHGRTFLFSSLVLFFGVLVYALLSNLLTAFFIVLPLTIGILYSFAGLKRFFLVKNLTVGCGWGILPLINASYYNVYSFEVLFYAVLCGAFWTINSTVFDIKDIVGDKSQNVVTMPVKFGPGKTKLFCFVLNLIMLLSLAFLLFNELLPSLFLIFGVINFYLFIYIYLAKEKNNPWFYGILVDGEFVFVGLLFVLTNFLS